MHPEILNDKAREILSRIKNFKSFYLAGGTALALQIAHRTSADFDLFTEKEISKKLLIQAEKVLSGFEIDILVNNRDELTILIDKIKLTFLSYPFPLVLKPTTFDGINILKIPEIAATKAYAIGRRATYKDYIDIFFIVSENSCTVERIIKLAQRKFKKNFDARLFLEQLTYMEDAEDTNIQFLRNPVDKITVQKFFEDGVKKIKL